MKAKILILGVITSSGLFVACSMASTSKLAVDMSKDEPVKETVSYNNEDLAKYKEYGQIRMKAMEVFKQTQEDEARRIAENNRSAKEQPVKPVEQKPAEKPVSKPAPTPFKFPAKRNEKIGDMRLVIPKINIDLWVQIGNGDCQKEMRVGPCTAPQGSTSRPQNDGTVAVGAHRTGYGDLFYYIDRLETGDDIYFSDNDGRTYHYKVDFLKVVNEYDFSLFKKVKGQNKLVLFSCMLDKSQSHYRQAVSCNLVESYKTK